MVGASGNVGPFAVQIAKAMGAHVTGVSSRSKVDLVRELGADEVLDYESVDYTRSGRNNQEAGGGQLWSCASTKRPTLEASYGFNTLMNWVSLAQVTTPSETVALCDAGINDQLQPILSTHVFPPSAVSTPGIGRPNPRHLDGLSVGFMDGHAKWMKMTPPFYPDVAGKWTGNGVTDPNNPQYKNQLWDLW